jgi:hypothetical protein
VKQKGRELDTRLPSARKGLQGCFEISPLNLELASHLTAFPIGLTAVPNQELESVLPRQKRVVLSEISDFQFGMANDFASIQLIVPQNALEQRRFSGAIASDESNLGIARKGAFGGFEKNLITVPFVGVSYLEQNRHTKVMME